MSKRTQSGSEGTRAEQEGQDLLDAGEDGGRELLEFENASNQRASIKVIGVGGGGGNALDNMIA